MTMKEIPHVLACDVGNSAIHFAHVHGQDVDDMHVMRLGELTGLRDELERMWLTMPAPKKLVAGSVNPTALEILESAAEQSVQEPLLVIGRDLPLPIATDLPQPELIGVDRLCAAAAAFDQLGVACVVADFGSAVTVDCVSEHGVFLGGAIMPGLAMSARSLHSDTAMLPLVEPTSPDWVFGKDTRQAIAGGLVLAARGALRELVEAYATELGHWPVVILTGGDARLIGGDGAASDIVQAIVPDLTIRGVAIAYYRTLIE